MIVFMKWRSILRILGLLSILFSFFMWLPILIALIYKDGSGIVFFQAFLASLGLGLFCWLPNRHFNDELNTREGFLIVVLFWLVLGFIGAFPFFFDNRLHLDVTTALFESFSGLTTTGATTIAHPELLPKALLFYRQLQQWLGGMGIIVLAVAILPVLGVGGIQLYRAEIPGPQKNDKVQPRIAQTAKSLWLIYILFTVICGVSLWFAGMSPFDAICHSFSTISIGGFSTHADGLAYFNSPAVNYIVTFFLIVSGCNYALHFNLFYLFSFKQYIKDQELKVFLLFLLGLILICLFVLYIHLEVKHIRVDEVITQVVSAATTGGFYVVDMKVWPVGLSLLLLCATFIGCCAGSTGGGVKVVRVMLFFLQGAKEVKRLVHPQGVYRLKLNHHVIPDRVIESVWAFFSAYIFIFIISFFVVMMCGIDAVDAFYVIASSLNNFGVGIDAAGANTTLNDVGSVVKWTMILNMLLGRLEIFTLLIIFTPVFWRT